MFKHLLEYGALTIAFEPLPSLDSVFASVVNQSAFLGLLDVLICPFRNASCFALVTIFLSHYFILRSVLLKFLSNFKVRRDTDCFLTLIAITNSNILRVVITSSFVLLFLL